MSISKNYIEIKGNITFWRAVTGMIQPTPDMYQPLLIAITCIFPNKHHYVDELKNFGTGQPM